MFHIYTHTRAQSRTCMHTHTFVFVNCGAVHMRNGFYTVQTIFSIALHLDLPLTENFLHFYFHKKNSLCMIYKRLEKWGHGEMSS